MSRWKSRQAIGFKGEPVSVIGRVACFITSDSFHIHICHSGTFVYLLPEVKVPLLRVTGYVGVLFLHTTKEVADRHVMVG